MELYLTLNTEERQLLGQQYPQEKQRMNQLTARWYEEGRIEGRQQGRLEGQQEGRLEGQLKTLVRQLTRRFGTLDKATETRLQGATQGELDRWTDSILTAQALVASLLRGRSQSSARPPDRYLSSIRTTGQQGSPASP